MDQKKSHICPLLKSTLLKKEMEKAKLFSMFIASDFSRKKIVLQESHVLKTTGELQSKEYSVLLEGE